MGAGHGAAGCGEVLLKCSPSPLLPLVSPLATTAVSIESTGCMPAAELFTEAIRILQDKCADTLAGLTEALDA